MPIKQITWRVPLLIFCLSFVLSTVFAPSLGLVHYQQLDFLLVLLLSLPLISLPFVLLEMSLAKRSQRDPLLGFMQLTRDADVSVRWRVLSWAMLLLLPFLAGGVLNFSLNSAQGLVELPIEHSLLMLILAVVGFGLVFLPQVLLLGVLACAVVLSIVASLMGSVASPSLWQWTNFEWVEWAKITSLVLLTSGLGLGIYWQTSVTQVKTAKQLAPLALPIWLAQGVALVLFLLLNQINSLLHWSAMLLATLTTAGLLLQFTRAQLQSKATPLAIQGLILLVPMLVWVIPHTEAVFYPLALLAGLALSFGLCVFVGWLMKVSHLRKALNLPSEALYNVWRVLVRLVIPLGIVLAFIGWVLAWVN